MITRLYIIALGVTAALPAAGEAQEPQYFQSPDPRISSVFMAAPGVLVEGAGFRTWTLATLQDSLKATGIPLFANSRTGNGPRSIASFPQGVILQSRGDSAVTVFVAVIEPQDRSMLTVRTISGDSTRSLSPWPALAEIARAPFRVLHAGMLASIHARGAGLTPQLTMTTRADSAALTLVWATLAAHRTVEDAATARRTLATSPSLYDRLAAVTILANFDHDDATWHALVGALLDPQDPVREYARSVLRAFTSDFTRRVDWLPGAAELHAILQGSDLLFLPEVLDMLVATGVGPDLASPLLRNGGHAVLMFAGAQNPWARGPAHRFLRVVSGRRVGGIPESWRSWIAAL